MAATTNVIRRITAHATINPVNSRSFEGFRAKGKGTLLDNNAIRKQGTVHQASNGQNDTARSRLRTSVPNRSHAEVTKADEIIKSRDGSDEPTLATTREQTAAKNTNGSTPRIHIRQG